MGLFETEKLFGLSYVIDPNSSYVSMSANESAVDSLQYPHQTLFYRGGDCDDMSILYSALLEAVGVRTAFITIPGHIFMAFDLGMTEAQARKEFFDPSLLIFRSGRAWVPVEITMVKEGFVKAWRVGAKEWADTSAAGTAAFYPMEESWRLYPPVGIPDVNPRFSLPDEALVIQSFDEAVNRYVAREIDPAVRGYKARLAEGASPEMANELGILLGRNGLLREAWAQFTVCAQAPRVYGWTNLANVAFLRGDYGLAVSYYEWALQQEPGNPVALLGIARSSYEMERFDRAGTAYTELAAVDPALAEEYGYLASSMGGAGRAWSFADRLTSTVWDEPGRRVAALPVATPAPPAAEEPRPEPLAGQPAAIEVVAAASEPSQAPATIAVQPEEPAPQPLPPPKIAEELPVDRDVVAAAAVRVVTVQAAPKEPLSAPAPAPRASPAPEPVREPAQQPAPEPAPVPQPEPAPMPQPGPEPAPQPGHAPAPQVEPGPVVVAAAPPSAMPTAKEPPAEEPLAQVQPARQPVPDSRVIFEGFGGSVRYSGRWTVRQSSALQTDEKALSAKLALPLVQQGGPLNYAVTARSQGSGWVGVGLHVLVRGAERHRGWGEGSSILAWLTSDPEHRGDTLTRLQVYRSRSDIDMRLVDEVIVPESVFESNEISVRVDPAGGTVAVWLNGTERLACPGLDGLGTGVTVVFRSIDRAVFQDFRVEELP
jgi:hypothetical protein